MSEAEFDCLSQITAIVTLVFFVLDATVHAVCVGLITWGVGDEVHMACIATGAYFVVAVRLKTHFTLKRLESKIRLTKPNQN